MIPLVDLKAQYLSIKTEIDAAIANIIANTQFIGGAELSDFEQAFAAYQGTKYCVGCANGTSAIFLTLQALGIQAGDEIITTPHTFIATIEPIQQVGAIPIFVDIDPKTYNIDPQRIEAAISPKTKAIMPVHLYGQLAQMDTIAQIAKRHNLLIVEDAAQAHGAVYQGKKAGYWGDAATFSFYPGKNLGAYGDAGAVCTNNAQVAGAVAKLRNHGRSNKYEHEMLGYGERMDSLQSAILRVKLAHLDKWNEKRRKHAIYYDKALSNVDGIITPTVLAENQPVYHIYCVRVESSKRDAVLKILNDKGIGAGIHYPIPLHLQTALAHLNIKKGAFPCTEQAAESIISLPLFPEMTNEQREFVVQTLIEAIQ